MPHEDLATASGKRQDPPLEFRGQHALVSGGSSGIGRATALLLARKGANVTIVARRRSLLEEAAAEINRARATPDQRVLWLQADVSQPSPAGAAIGEALAELGPVDLLICCAGVARPGYFGELAPEVFEEAMRTNFFGTLYAIQAVMPSMRERARGHIVLVASAAALMGVFGYTAYAASKFAVRGLAESLRAELQGSGIHVSVVYPPDVDTPQLAEEEKTKPLEAKAISRAVSLWKPDAMAAVIVEGIRRRSFVITAGLEMKLLVHLHSVIAPVLRRYFDGVARRAHVPADPQAVSGRPH